MTITLAVANQKGGVAKTTTVATLGAAFAEQDLDVLLVDLDPQACLTFSLGVDPDAVELSVHEVLTAGVPVRDAVLALDPGAGRGKPLHLLPATLDLAAAEGALFGTDRRETALARALDPARADYDVIVLDCSPSLGLLTINALAAADDVLVPLQCEMLSHRGVGQLLDTVADVKRLVNPGLEIVGLLPVMFDPRTTHARAVLADLAGRYGLPVLEPPVPRSVRFAEATALGRTVLRAARTSKGAEAYRQVAAALVRTWGARTGGE